MDKENVIYLSIVYNGMLFSSEKKEILSFDSVNEPGRHHA